MAGYNGWSKSNNAIVAEEGGRYPLSIAVKKMAEKTGVTQKKCRAILEKVGSFEYHHSSKNYNCVDYYDVDDAIEKMDDVDSNLNYEVIQDEIINVFPSQFYRRRSNLIFAIRNISEKNKKRLINNFLERRQKK